MDKLGNWLWPRAGLSRAWRYLMLRLLRMKASPHKLALGFAAGALASFTPFMGFHFILAALMAFAVRGHLLASAIGTVVGNPLTFPFIWLASYNLGAAILGEKAKSEVIIALHSQSPSILGHPYDFLQALWSKLEPVLWPMLVGGIPLGLLCATACYWIVRAGLTQLSHYKRLDRVRGSDHKFNPRARRPL